MVMMSACRQRGGGHNDEANEPQIDPTLTLMEPQRLDGQVIDNARCRFCF